MGSCCRVQRELQRVLSPVSVEGSLWMISGKELESAPPPNLALCTHVQNTTRAVTKNWRLDCGHCFVSVRTQNGVRTISSGLTLW